MKPARGSIGIYLIIGLVIVVAMLLEGGSPFSKYHSSPGAPDEITEASASGQCCDSGNGDQCKPELTDTTKQFTWTKNGKVYGLLKSDITLAEAPAHLKEYIGQKL